MAIHWDRVKQPVTIRWDRVKQPVTTHRDRIKQPVATHRDRVKPVAIRRIELNQWPYWGIELNNQDTTTPSSPDAPHPPHTLARCTGSRPAWCAVCGAVVWRVAAHNTHAGRWIPGEKGKSDVPWLTLPKGDTLCNGQHICFHSLPPMLLCNYLKTTNFSILLLSFALV